LDINPLDMEKILAEKEKLKKVKEFFTET